MNVDWLFAGNLVGSGILIVFLALIALVALIMVMGKVLNKGDSSAAQSAVSVNAAPAAPAKAASVPAMQIEDGIEDEVIAVISAAIAAMMSAEGVPAGSYTVKSVKRAREARPVWAMAGMMQNTKPF